MFYFQLRFIYACKPESTRDLKYVLDSVMTFLGGAWVKIWGLLLKFIRERHAQINPPPEEHSLWASISFFSCWRIFLPHVIIEPPFELNAQLWQGMVDRFSKSQHLYFQGFAKNGIKIMPFLFPPYFVHEIFLLHWPRFSPQCWEQYKNTSTLSNYAIMRNSWIRFLVQSAFHNNCLEVIKRKWGWNSCFMKRLLR